MKKIFNILITLALFAPFADANATCQRCERIREENARKAKDQNWVFYEDWVKMQKDEGEPDSGSVSLEDPKQD